MPCASGGVPVVEDILGALSGLFLQFIGLRYRLKIDVAAGVAGIPAGCDSASCVLAAAWRG